uniref:Ig-like domain-containing protein n=1 Tax=Anabas testudineus TaxID=64144 RepID=A0A3Q1J556_ANATE
SRPEIYLCCVTGAAEIIHVYEGGSVSISCPYESQDQNNMKYICRGNQPSSCLQQALITSNNRQNTQFSLTDDKESKFTVTITSLTQKDSGSYLCGVKRNTGLDVFSAVDLEVRGERSQFKGKRDQAGCIGACIETPESRSKLRTSLLFRFALRSLKMFLSFLLAQSLSVCVIGSLHFNAF